MLDNPFNRHRLLPPLAPLEVEVQHRIARNHAGGAESPLENLGIIKRLDPLFFQKRPNDEMKMGLRKAVIADDEEDLFTPFSLSFQSSHQFSRRMVHPSVSFQRMRVARIAQVGILIDAGKQQKQKFEIL